MKNIGISKNIKKEFLDWKADDEPINDALARLFEESKIKTYEHDDTPTSFRITDENLDKLKSFKAYPTEPYSSVLLRLLESVDDQF